MNPTPDFCCLPLDARDRRIARWILLAAAALFTLLSFGYVESIDAEMDFQSARGLVVHHDLAVHADNPAGREICARGIMGRRGQKGKFYSWHGPGRAIVTAPLYALGEVFSALFPEVEKTYAASGADLRATEAPPAEYFPQLFFTLSSAWMGAAVVALLYLAARVLGSGRRGALAAPLILALASYFGPGTRSALNAVQTALLLVWPTWIWLRLAHPERDGREVRRWMLLASGLVLGLAVWTRPTAAMAAALISVYGFLALVRRRRARAWFLDGLAHGAGAALILAAMLAFNRFRFGSWSEFGHGAAIRHAGFLITDPVLLASNLIGLVISPAKGILWYAPVLVFTPLAARSFGRRMGLERFLLILVAATFFAWPIFSEGWHGGPFFGPRYQLPALPFLVLVLTYPLGVWVRKGGWRCMAVGFAIIAGVFVQLPGFLVSYRTSHELIYAAAERAVPLDPAFRVDPRGGQSREAAWNNGPRTMYLQWHPRFMPLLVQGGVLWHRLTCWEGDEEERLPLAGAFAVWDAAPYLRPAHLEARRFNNLWWVALHRRFGSTFAAVLAGMLAGVVLVAGFFALRGALASREEEFARIPRRPVDDP